VSLLADDPVAGVTGVVPRFEITFLILETWGIARNRQ
jgi:hypothetical protein